MWIIEVFSKKRRATKHARFQLAVHTLSNHCASNPATEHARNQLSLSRLDSLASGLEVVWSCGTAATEHSYRLITAVSLLVIVFSVTATEHACSLVLTVIRQS